MVAQSWPSRSLGALVGIASGAVSLGVAEVVAAFTGTRGAPVIAVGNAVIDAVPLSVKDWATSTFGTNDKTALITGILILLTIAAGVIGAWAVRNIWIGYGGIAVFGIIGAVSAATRPGLGASAMIPSIIGAAAGAATLAALLRGWHATKPDLEADSGRRTVLIGALVALAGAAIADLVGRQLGERKNVSTARNEVVLPTPSVPPPSLPPDAAVRGQSSFVTSNSSFYRIDTALEPPQVDPKTWSLRIYGQVDHEITLTYDQLLARPMIERYVTLCCVSNPVGGPLIGNALWLGTPLKDLLDEAGVHAGADQIVGRSTDGFTAGSPTSVVMDGRDAMLAVGMNGMPLPVDHGFPVRMIVPGLYGYVSATKWITEIEVTTFAAFDAYWVPRGWSAMGPIKTESRIDTPQDGSSRKSGTVVVAGVAWAQHRGISKVEVQVDNGPWQTATLDAVPSTDTWRQWRWDWAATPGSHKLSVRATDNAGQTQTSQVADVAPNGATGYHVIGVTIT